MKIFKKILLALLLLIVLAALAFTIFTRYNAEPKMPEPAPTLTPQPTPEPTPEPEPEYFTISIVGDNTLSSSKSGGTFVSVVGEDYAYPYANTVEYFENDDLSIANLECNLSDSTLYSTSMFSFKAPTKYAQILSKGSIEFVTTANNHIGDFGQTGVQDTYAALDGAGISYGRDGNSTIYETKSGLKVGIYCGSSYISADYVKSQIAKLREDGAEYIICAMHWGNEGEYSPTQSQQTLAHACIDAGANLVYGSHPHVLQPMEEYNKGLILYSMGNWTFGGNRSPKDMDTAIVQITVKRDLDGSVSTDSYSLIPCCMSSRADYNNYQPTPYPEDSDEYKRTISKLDGSFTGSNLVVDYSILNKKSSKGTTSAPQASSSPSTPGTAESQTSGGGTEASAEPTP